jgi:hypothetical protein
MQASVVTDNKSWALFKLYIVLYGARRLNRALLRRGYRYHHDVQVEFRIWPKRIARVIYLRPHRGS